MGLMRSLLWIIGLVLLVAQPARADPADIAAAGRGVVRVVLVSNEGENVSFVGHGSGFAVAPNLIVTNAHVVAPLREDSMLSVGVVPSEGTTGYAAELVAFSPNNDLALLRLVDQGSLPALALFTGPVNDGADVYAVGYPGNVDLAQGLSMAEIVQPQTAVKTRGYVSAGRSSRQFETILHTAPVGSGNSGGPLLDGCGRVIGVNSFGTLSGEADSEFYFAVTVRELLGFLRQAEVQPRLTGNPCRSLAELEREEMNQQARREAEARRKASADERTRDLAQRRAELQLLVERENGMALAALLLVLAAVVAGAAMVLEVRSRRRGAVVAAALAILLLVGAVIVWFARPGWGELDDGTAGNSEEAGTARAAAGPAGALICAFDPGRSRATVSDTSDVALTWTEGGCVNSRTQYGLADGVWSRILVPADEATVSVNSYDPASGTYRVERFLLDQAAMRAAREARARFSSPACGNGIAVARRLGQEQRAIRTLLPPTANERLLYNCRRG